MSHLFLLGDSIFDNAAYTEGGPDVVTQLRAALSAGWAASLLAIDGSTTGQVGCLPLVRQGLRLPGWGDCVPPSVIA